jgi:hypothetical protein
MSQTPASLNSLSRYRNIDTSKITYWSCNVLDDSLTYKDVVLSGNTIKIKTASTPTVTYSALVDYDYVNNAFYNINKLYLNGSERLSVYSSGVYVSGNLTATSTVTSSDIRLKNVLEPIENPISKIEKISGFRYLPNELALSCNLLADKMYVGISAQDVQTVFPELVCLAAFDTCNLMSGQVVSKSGNNYLAVSYERMIPILIECVKELKKEIDILKC